MNTKHSRLVTTLSPLWLIPVAVMIAGLGFIGYYHFWRSHAQTPTSHVTTTKSGDYINLNPAAPNEQNTNKDNPTSQPTPTPSPTQNGKQSVNITVTSTAPSAVRAYTQGVIEDGGTCTASFSNGTITKTNSSTGISNVSDTVCPPIDVADVGTGTWNLTYTYSSDKYAGSVTQQVSL